MSARSHRRWFQFSIRGLLLLMTIVAVGLSLWGSKFHRRHQALSRLRPFMRRGSVQFEEPPTARWLRRQKWLTKLVGDDWFDEPVGIRMTGMPSPKPRTPNGRVNDADLHSLEYLGTLRQLSLDHTAAGDEGMPYLRRLPNLERLDVAWSLVGDASLESMATLRNLRQLNLSGTQVTDSGLRHLSRLKSLQQLNLTNTGVGDDGIAALNDLRELVWLDLTQTDVRGNALGDLHECKSIERLLLSDTRLGEQALAALQHFPRLDRLSLRGSTITGRGFAAVDTLPALTELDLGRTALTDEGLLALPSAPRLRRLLLNETPITDKGLQRLGKFKSLETLELRGTKITGKALAYLQKLPQLSYLDLCDTQIEDSDIDAFNEICSLVSVALIGTHVTEQGLTKLQVAGSIASEPVVVRTMASLAEPTEMDFRRQPFTDVLDYLKQRHEEEIQVDPRLQQERSFLGLKVTSSCRGLSLLQALQELLAPPRLVLVYRHGVLQIMPRPVGPALRVPIVKAGERLSPRLDAALSQRTELDFYNHPLADVVDWLAHRHNIEIRIDADAFRDIEGPEDMPINRAIKGITLRSALGLLLEPLDLVCEAKGETLVIRPQDEVVANDRRNCALPVGDGP